MGERSPEERPGRARSVIVTLVALAAVLAVPASADANVMVVGTGTTLELKLDSAVSNIAISGPSDESVTFTELVLLGADLQHHVGRRDVLPRRGDADGDLHDGGFPALLVSDDGQAGQRDTLDEYTSPVLISTGGAGGLLAAPISAVEGRPQRLPERFERGRHDRLFR